MKPIDRGNHDSFIFSIREHTLALSCSVALTHTHTHTHTHTLDGCGGTFYLSALSQSILTEFIFFSVLFLNLNFSAAKLSIVLTSYLTIMSQKYFHSTSMFYCIVYSTFNSILPSWNAS